MGFLGGIGSVLSNSGKAVDIVDKGADGIINGLDKLVLTKEEMFDIAQKVSDTQLKVLEATAAENSIKSMTRRYLALMLICSYSFMTLMACGIWKWFPEWSNYIITTINAGTFGKLTLWFGIFYAGYYGAAQVIDHIKK